MTVNIALTAFTPGLHATMAAVSTMHALENSFELASGQGAVATDAIPSRPPPEVHDAIGVAAQSYEELLASGQRLGFGVDPTTQRVVVEIRDLEGNHLWTAPPSQALEVAAGAALQQTH